MPQGRRKVPFSGKQKKQQLLAKKQAKSSTSHNIIRKLRDEESSDISEDSDFPKTFHENVEKINLQPTKDPRSKANRYVLQFHRETGKELREMKEEALKELIPCRPEELELADNYFVGYEFPKRPKWTYEMSKEQLDSNENRYFFKYITYMEKMHYDDMKSLSFCELNLETWRQLWRVLELSDIVLVIVDARFPDRFHLYMHSLDDSGDSLKRALLLLDWDYSYMIVSAQESKRPVIQEVLRMCDVDVLWEVESSMKYELPVEECLKLELNLPEGLHLKKLGVEHAVIANQVWPWRHEGSEYFMKRLAAWNISIGLFNESDEMLAWSFVWPTGAIGPLEVAKAHLRKGYGTLIAKAIAKEVAKNGMNCYGTIVSGNDASVAMFVKLGFERVEDTYYVRTRAKKLVEYDH